MELTKIYELPFKILNNSLKKEKLSHAYLFSGDKRSLKLEMAKYFVEMIFCENKKGNGEVCGVCESCLSIKNNRFSEVKIIDPEGIHIKKEEILNIQEEFSKKALDGKYRVYIINNAERLNKSASNSLLKFLEEPCTGVIAILICNNSHELLSTIISRCQNIIFKNASDCGKIEENKQLYLISSVLRETKEEMNELIENESFKEKISDVFNFIDTIEKKNMDAFLFEKKLVLDKFKTKEEVNELIKLITLFYVDVVNYNYMKKIDLFIDEEIRIKSIIFSNGIAKITRKVQILVEISELIKYNINLNLLIDRLIFLFKEVENV